MCASTFISVCSTLNGFLIQLYISLNVSNGSAQPCFHHVEKSIALWHVNWLNSDTKLPTDIWIHEKHNIVSAMREFNHRVSPTKYRIPMIDIPQRDIFSKQNFIILGFFSVLDFTTPRVLNAWIFCLHCMNAHACLMHLNIVYKYTYIYVHSWGMYSYVKCQHRLSKSHLKNYVCFQIYVLWCRIMCACMCSGGKVI